MKRGIIVLLAALLIAATSGKALAEEEKKEGEGNGIEIEAGVKAWYNKMQHREPLKDLDVTSDPTFLLGPVVEVKIAHHFFVEAAYFATTSDYRMSDALRSIKADRSDIDLAAGYLFTPHVGIYIGYLQIDQRFTTTESATGIAESSKTKLTGAVFGVRGDIPVTETFGIYGNASYLDTKVKVTEPDPLLSVSEDAPGMIFELGVKAEMMKHLSAMLGYKYETTKGDRTSTKDTFSGFTLAAMYEF